MRFLRAAAILGLAAVAAWALRRYGVWGGDPWDPLTLRDWVTGAGVWGPAVFLAVATAKPLVVPYPVGLAWVAGGLFGTLPGGALVAAAGVTSSAVGYAVGMAGRRLAGRGLPRPPADLLPEGEGAGRGFDWRAVALLRAVVPWDLVSYWAGGRRLPLSTYAAGTGAALLPVSFAHAFAASALVEGQAAQLGLAVPLALGLLYGPLWYFGRRREGRRG
ncbi:MAG: VTT domain-containing protein [Thermodesulfobacteriota bacterium]